MPDQTNILPRSMCINTKGRINAFSGKAKSKRTLKHKRNIRMKNSGKSDEIIK
jgi:hypothetical protein